MEKHKAMYGPVLLSLCQVCIVDYNLNKTAVTQKSLAASNACVPFLEVLVMGSPAGLSLHTLGRKIN